MDILIGILTVIEVLVCLLLILVVLMQRPRQEGLGASFGDSMTSQMWGAQTTNVLQKFTVYLAIALFSLTLLLAVLTAKSQRNRLDLSDMAGPAPAAIEAPTPPDAAPPALPTPAQTPDSKAAAAPTPASGTTSVSKQPGGTVVVKKGDDAKANAAKADAPKTEAPKAAAPKAAGETKAATPPPPTPTTAPAPKAPATAPVPVTPPADQAK